MRQTSRMTYCAVALTLSWALIAGSLAQSNEPAATDPPAPPAPAPALPAPPPPGEEVMRPTEHGLRLTPAMARAMARAMAAGTGKELKTTAEQQKRLSDVYARRMMETARAYEEPGQALAEYALEALWRSASSGQGMKFTPEMARELGTRAIPAMPGIHELLDGIVKDAEPILDPQAMEKLRKEMEDANKGLDRFEQVMQRWSQGGMKEGENPFDDSDEPTTKPDGTAAEPPKARSPEVKQAEQVADWTLSSTGVNEWTWFLQQAKDCFKFDEQQSAKAEQIMAEYRSKAEAIMTPDWKEAMRQNRIKINLRDKLKGVPTIPWMWRLQHDYDLAIKPVRELGWSFRKDILGLITSQQRDTALGEIAARSAEHGLKIEDNDKAVLGLAGSVWSLWKF